MASVISAKAKNVPGHNNYKKLNPNNWQMWKLILLRRCKQIRFLNFSVIHYYFLWLTHKSLLYIFEQLVTAPVTVCTLSVLLCSIVIKVIFRYLTFSSGNIRIMWFFIHFINAKKNRLLEGVPSVQRSFWLFNYSCPLTSSVATSSPNHFWLICWKMPSW